MSSTNEKSTSGAGRRQSRASMGNFGNDDVDRSEETTLTRRQRRQQRRETLRLQAEVAPFMDMDLDDEEDTKEVTKVEKKNEEEKKEEPDKKMIDTPLDTILEVDESIVEEEPMSTGLRPGAFKTPPTGESEFPGHKEKWWTRGVMDPVTPLPFCATAFDGSAMILHIGRDTCKDCYFD
ncbi:unnamed protein product, partial [Fusarium langsethiae]